jgi:hypothetical protein
MAKSSQMFVLYNLMKAAGNKGVGKKEVAKALNVKESSVPVYFFAMKKYFKAEYDIVKQGRQIVAYKLINSDKISVPQFRKGKVKVVKASNPVVTKVVKNKKVDEVPNIEDDSGITQITDREFSDIKSTLGLI